MVVRGRRWWAAGAAAVVVAGVAVVAVALASRGGGVDDLPPAVRAQLAISARDALEGGADPVQRPDVGRQACAVRVLGADPEGITSADQARTVYVDAWCAWIDTEVQTESAIPEAVRLTDPPVAESPGDGSLYGPDIERIFPERLQDAVFDGGDPDEMDTRLRERIAERRRT
ncbi:hypothetical protein FB565_008186 [Actinoplanes lutulentus]|uniref:Uncharacterized protein n=1 Tax=Actinoplanes lutulentus TaxID=1287878 RepID=A0A327ZGB9_9ACTN|nr:hypothetical protein [Actinoplanes lutulentus]MBB2948403.1 hypothetical protein [Actinoplanes lutulentus]RAK34564.1 hypothetical protein B0I29_111166 [Actinoplanes lutulentus]